MATEDGKPNNDLEVALVSLFLECYNKSIPGRRAVIAAFFIPPKWWSRGTCTLSLAKKAKVKCELPKDTDERGDAFRKIAKILKDVEEKL